MSVEVKNTDSKNKINLIELVNLYWRERITLLVFSGIFVVVGFLMAFSAQEEFTSQVKLHPENNQESQLGGLSSLARQFGVPASVSSGEGIPVSLYPDVAKNLVMMRQLMNYEVMRRPNGESVTLQDYLQNEVTPNIFARITGATLGLPKKLFNQFRNLISIGKNNNLIQRDGVDSGASGGMKDSEQVIQRFDDAEWKMIQNLRDRISVSQDFETGIIYVDVKMPDPVLAAEVAHQVVQFLTAYITDYRTEKTRDDVKFVEERLEEARVKFEEAQKALASYSDRQRGVTRATDDIERQKLENEFSIAFNVYNIMSQRLEETRIRLQEVTPVVSILDPPAVPNQRSEPSRMRIFLTISAMGLVAGVVFVNIKEKVKDYLG